MKRYLFLLFFIPYALLAQEQKLTATEDLIERYSSILVNLRNDDLESALELLLGDAITFRDANIKDPDAWITVGRIRAGYARTQGTRKGLKLVKEVRSEIEESISLNPEAQGGFAKGFLGRIYMDLPGWPLSFGNDDKGEALIKEALEVDSTNSTNSFFYAQFLLSKKKYNEANEYLDIALKAVNLEVNRPQWQAFQRRNIGNIRRIILENNNK